MAPRRRTPQSTLSDTQPSQTVCFSDVQFKQLLNALAPKSLPEPLKTLPVHLKFAPHLHDVFSFTRLLTDVDPKRVHECLQHEAKEWYESLGDAIRAGLGTSTRHWKNELERRFGRDTADKASVTLPEQQESPRETQMAATPVQQIPHQITLQPSEQPAPSSVDTQHDTLHNTPHDTPHDTQTASIHPQPNPQPIITQTPKQRAPPAAVRFLEKVDYKFDGPCCMRHLSKLINTVDRSLMMSTPHLIQLQYQALGGAHFAYFWSNSRPPGPLTQLKATGPTHPHTRPPAHPHSRPPACHTLARLIFGDYANRTRLAGFLLENHDNFPGRDSDNSRHSLSMRTPPTLISQPPHDRIGSSTHSGLCQHRPYVRGPCHSVF